MAEAREGGGEVEDVGLNAAQEGGEEVGDYQSMRRERRILEIVSANVIETRRAPSIPTASRNACRCFATCKISPRRIDRDEDIRVTTLRGTAISTIVSEDIDGVQSTVCCLSRVC